MSFDLLVMAHRADGTEVLVALDHITVVDAVVKLNRANEPERDSNGNPKVVGSVVGFDSGATLQIEESPEEFADVCSAALGAVGKLGRSE